MTRSSDDPAARAYRLLSASIVAAVLIAGAVAYGVWQMNRERDETIAKVLTMGDPSRAPPLIRRYGCGGCHTISAVPGADGKVAPPLDGLRHHVFIGGVVRNTPDALVRWIVSPQSFSPRSAMPVTDITEEEARDIAAFLYAH